MSDHTSPRPRRWPLALLALPAAVTIWSGWVGLGQMAGFGMVHPLPGIADEFTLNSAITLPIGVEAYASLALGTWLSARPIPRTARRFAAWSSLAALGLGLLGQVVYHLLTAAGYTQAPIPVVVFVACLPVLVLGAGAALHHLLGAPTNPNSDRLDADVSTSRESVTVAGVPADGGQAGVWDAPACPSPGVPAVPSHSPRALPPVESTGEPGPAALVGGLEVGRTPGMRRALSQADRARTIAQLHAARTGELPTVRELAELAEVGRGSAERALTGLRATTHDPPATSNGLHVVGDPNHEGPQQ